MNCSASVVNGLVVLPDLTIVFPNSTMISEDGTNSLVYMFSPLRMSDGGQYTCTAVVNIPVAGIILQSSVTEAVVAVCKYELITPLAGDYVYTLCRCLFSVPV